MIKDSRSNNAANFAIVTLSTSIPPDNVVNPRIVSASSNSVISVTES